MSRMIYAFGIVCGLALAAPPAFATDPSGENRTGPSEAVQEKAPMPGPGSSDDQPIGSGSAVPPPSIKDDGPTAGTDAVPPAAPPPAPPAQSGPQGGDSGGLPYLRGPDGGNNL